jgi:hypothetical protein
MPVIITESENISTIHRAVRLQSELGAAEEDVNRMALLIYFQVESQLLNGKTVGKPYWDLENPLLLTCENDLELAEAMKVIQKKLEKVATNKL